MKGGASLGNELIFFKAFGAVPVNRVILFLLENNIFDYSKSDIAKYAGVSRMTLDKFFNSLDEFKIVLKTRDVGRATLYRINLESQIVQEFAKLNEAVTNSYEEKLFGKEKSFA